MWCHLYRVFTQIYSHLIEEDIIKMFQLSFHVFMCAFYPEISSFFQHEFPLSFLIFGLFNLFMLLSNGDQLESYLRKANKITSISKYQHLECNPLQQLSCSLDKTKQKICIQSSISANLHNPQQQASIADTRQYELVEYSMKMLRRWQ